MRLETVVASLKEFMIIDIRTLAIFLCITTFLQAIALFAQYRLDKTHSGLGWWTLGSIVLALGFAFNYLRDFPTFESIAIVANNALFVSSLALFHVGVLRFQGRHEQSSRLIAFCVVFTLIIIYFTYINNDLTIRRIMISGAVAATSFLVSWNLLNPKAYPLKASTDFLAVVFLSNGVFFLIRALTPFMGIPIGDAFTSTLTQIATYLVMLVTSTLWTFGFIIMVNQCLIIKSVEAQKYSELIFNTSPDAALITRLTDGYLVDINEGFTALIGYSRAEVIGKSTLDVNFWKNPEDRQKLVLVLSEKGFCENLEAVFQRKNGSQFVGMISAKVITLRGIPHIISVTRDISERKKAEEEKLTADAKIRTLSVAIEQSPVTTVITDLAGNIIFVNPKFTETTGYTAEEAIGKNPRILKTENTPSSEYKDLWSSILAGQNWHGIFQNKKKSGELYWESAVISPVKDEDGTITHFLAVKEDITERKRGEEALKESMARYRAVFDSANDAIVSSDSMGNIVSWNHAAETIFGYSKSEAIGLSLTILMPSNLQDAHRAGMARLENGGEEHMIGKTAEVEGQRKDGSKFPLEISLAKWQVFDNNFYTATIRDITERKRLKEELQKQATTDELTGLTNRRHFLHLTSSEMKRAIRLQRPLTIALIDIDYFKHINDTYGHASGDQALRCFTKICQKNIREIDVIARLGGDEFALLFPETNNEQAYVAMERIRLAITDHPFDILEKQISITISSGIASLSSDKESFDELLSRADQALYHAKELGRNRVIGYDK
jgi:diguanylate cyclase (GGDEF)-like protein/PAS domain S-box-containing protein